ncbi:MAG TPA: hypothetical protein VNT42_05885 [Sphingomonas sp.]|nr:hypothetical protein [Sphingomonas sp.]
MKALHGEMRVALAELGREATKAVPDQIALPAARLRLARIDACRKSSINSICPILHDISLEDARKLEELRRDGYALALKVSQHVVCWSMRSIAADWASYTRASADLRALMFKRISEEIALLYPLLEARDQSSSDK